MIIWNNKKKRGAILQKLKKKKYTPSCKEGAVLHGRPPLEFLDCCLELLQDGPWDFWARRSLLRWLRERWEWLSMGTSLLFVLFKLKRLGRFLERDVCSGLGLDFRGFFPFSFTESWLLSIFFCFLGRKDEGAGIFFWLISHLKVLGIGGGIINFLSTAHANVSRDGAHSIGTRTRVVEDQVYQTIFILLSTKTKKEKSIFLYFICSKCVKFMCRISPFLWVGVKFCPTVLLGLCLRPT